jgi:hypothetical protein
MGRSTWPSPRRRGAAALDAEIAEAQRLGAASPSTWLLPTVQSARTQVLVHLGKAGRAAQDARAARVVIPAAFGASGAQTCIGAENLAEQRGYAAGMWARSGWRPPPRAA